MIRLGVDAWNLPGDRRGIGRYLRQILNVWWESQRHRLEVTLIVPEWHTWTVRQRYQDEAMQRPYRVVSRRAHGRAHLDALWFPFNGCSWTNFTLPATATLHDASNFALPGYAPQTQAIFRTAAQRCAALITDSHFAQGELAKALGFARERLTVIPLGVAPARVAAASSGALAVTEHDVHAFKPYVLYVGTAERRKGFDTLLAAMARVVRARPDLQLVVTTRLDGWIIPPGVRVVELGHVDDDTLAVLYRNCAVFTFPSRYEGFGLPILEAMSYGAPVIAANSSSLPEAGGNAAHYVAPENDGELADAIVRVLSEDAYANELGRRGKVWAAPFTWEKTAAQTLAVIEGTLR